MSLARGAWLLHPLRVVTDNYAGPALLQYECVSLLQGADIGPGPTSGEVRTRRWGHYYDLPLHSLKLPTAGALTGFDHLSGCLLPHRIATAY